MADISTEVEAICRQLQKARAVAERYEVLLREAIVRLISANHGAQQDWANRVGISISFASDIRHGRRGISDEMVRKILENSNAD